MSNGQVDERYKIKTMCINCDFKHIYHFESEAELLKFDLDFTKSFIKELDLIEANHSETSGLGCYHLYKCKTCGNLWAYSYPDNAWRGFFLPEQLAIRNVRNIKFANRLKLIAGSIVLIVLLIVVFRSCI